jgi:hypothetical protein
LTVFLNNVPIIKSDGKTVPPGLFSPFATGRVDPFGNFSSFTESIEYFFGHLVTAHSFSDWKVVFIRYDISFALTSKDEVLSPVGGSATAISSTAGMLPVPP